MEKDLPCPACTSSDWSMFFELEGVPTHCNVLLPTQGAARECPRADIRLGFCQSCGLIYNLAFDPALMRICLAIPDN